MRNVTLLRATVALTFAISVILGCSSSPDGDVDALPPADSPADTEATTSSSSSTTRTAITPTTPTSSTTESTKPLLDIPTEWESPEAEILGRYQLYWDALEIAYGPPEATPGYEPLVDLTGDQILADLQQVAQDLRADEMVLVVPEDSIDEHLLRLAEPSPIEKKEGQEVILQDCWVDDSEFRSTDGRLVATQYRSVLRNVTMKVIGGEWRVFAAIDATPESSGYQECATYLDELDSQS